MVWDYSKEAAILLSCSSKSGRELGRTLVGELECNLNMLFVHLGIRLLKSAELHIGSVSQTCKLSIQVDEMKIEYWVVNMSSKFSIGQELYVERRINDDSTFYKKVLLIPKKLHTGKVVTDVIFNDFLLICNNNWDNIENKCRARKNPKFSLTNSQLYLCMLTGLYRPA